MTPPEGFYVESVGGLLRHKRIEMSILYRAKRSGKHGKIFTMYKFRTLKEGVGDFADKRGYTWAGKFLRKTRLDELPQLWNVLKGNMSLVGPRPEEAKTIAIYPPDIREKLLSVKPGMFGMGGLFFINEEQALTSSDDPHRDYWEKIKPMKLTLDFFYIDNKCLSLDLWVIWQGLKIGIKNIWK